MFQIGDKVVCVKVRDGQHAILKLREIYTVTRVLRDTLRVEEVAGNFYHTRFVPLAEFKDFRVGDTVQVVDRDGVLAKMIDNGGEAVHNDLYIPPDMSRQFAKNPIFKVSQAPNEDHENALRLKNDEDMNDWLWPISWVVLSKGEIVKNVPAAKPKKVKKPKFKSLRAEQRAAQKKERGMGTCSYSLQFEDGSIRHQINDVCHARARRQIYGKKDGEVTAMALHISSYEVAKKQSYKDYVKFILNDSPWAPCFNTKSVAIAMRYGILMDVDKPINEVVGACIALREGSEFKGKLALFSYVLKLGFSGKTAYIISSMMGGKDANGNYKFTGCPGGGHKAWNDDISMQKMFAFFKAGYGKSASQSMRTGTVYRIDSHITDVADVSVLTEEQRKLFGEKIFRSIKELVPHDGPAANDGWGEKTVFYKEDGLKKLCKFVEEALS